MAHRIEVRIKETHRDVEGEKIKQIIYDELGKTVSEVRKIEVYNIDN